MDVNPRLLGPSTDQLNDPEYGRLWLDMTETNKKTAADISAGWIKDRLREAAFHSKIIPEETLSPMDRNIQRSTRHDGFAVMVSVLPESVAAMTLTMRATPDALLASGDRFLMGFWTVATTRIQFDLPGLPAYGDMPLTKIFEQNAIKSLHDVRDRTLITHADVAVDFMQETGNDDVVAFNVSGLANGDVASYSKIKGAIAVANGVDNFVPTRILPEDVVAAIGRFGEQQISASGETRVRVGGLVPAVGLINSQDFLQTSLTTMEEVGGALQEKHYVQGVQGDTIKGLVFVKTIKNEVVRRGNVYVFTSADYLGKSYVWRDLQFWIERSATMLSWFAWMDVGMCLSNVAAIVKIELYGGSTTTGEEDTGYAAAIPMPEKDVGTGRNNKVREGGLSSFVVM